MTLTIDNYKEALSKQLLKQTAKLAVRECDETSKGHYVAYVDEGNLTFDLSLTVLTNKEIGSHTCDCEEGSGFCKHKAALLLHITSKKKRTTSIKAKNTLKKSEILLQEAELGDLKEWLGKLFEKNPDIELSFIHHFSSETQKYTPEEVVKITNDAIKVVAGKKKAVDLTQVKKLVELWTVVHAPIVEGYKANTADENNFQNFHVLLDSCYLFQFETRTTSNRIPKYIETLLSQSVEYIANLYSNELWEKAINYFIVHSYENGKTIRLHYLHHLRSIISISEDQRVKKIIALLASHYGKSPGKGVLDLKYYTRKLFEIIKDHDLVTTYIDLFRPIHFDNDFNEQLISSLIENEKLEVAEKYCKEQIAVNNREEYNTPYLRFLKQIYTLKQDKKSLASVLRRLFPQTFDINDYLFISENLSPDERKQWRSKMLTRAKHVSRSYLTQAAEFYFKVMDLEKNYRKMIDSIDTYTPYAIILEYFEPMFLTNKDRLLHAIYNKDDYLAWGAPANYREKDESCFPQLCELIMKHYSPVFLNIYLKQNSTHGYFRSSNNLIDYLANRLSDLGKAR